MTDRNFADSHVLENVKDTTTVQRGRAVRYILGNTTDLADALHLFDVLGLDPHEAR